VSFIDFRRASDSVPAIFTGWALGFITIMLVLVSLNAMVIDGAGDCVQHVNSIACKFAQLIAN
jgi:hypothetical protein